MSNARKSLVLISAIAAIALGNAACVTEKKHQAPAQPAAEQPKAEHPKADHPKGEHPKGEHPKG